MKKYLNLLGLSLGVAIVLGATASVSKADYAVSNGYRYKVVYSDWDSGFYGYYGYSETTCGAQADGAFIVHTCYTTIQPTDYVWIEERHVDGGWDRVTVYSDSGYGNAVVEYDVYDNGPGTRRVERRHYFAGGPDYQSSYYVTDQTTWVSINWDNGWGKIVGGLEVGLVGADIIANSNGNTGAVIVGAAVLASGSASSAAGASQLKQESDLEKSLAAKQSAGGTDVQ